MVSRLTCACSMRVMPSDEWFVERVRHGAVRDGRVYMPKMADYLSQEALWAVRTYLDSVHVEE